MQLWTKFRLLLWKNWLIQRRHPLQSCLEIIVPVLCTAVLVLLRSLVRVVEYPDEWHYPAVNLVVAYAPASAFLDELIGHAVVALGLHGFIAFSDATNLEHNMTANPRLLAGIEFAGNNETYATALPRHLNYSLRFPGELRTIYHQRNPLLFNWQTDKSIPAFQEPGPRTRYDADGGIPPGYIREGFLPLQHALATAFLRLHNSSAQMPEVHMRRFPYPPFRMDLLINGLELVMPIILVVSFIYPCITLTKVIALEKERQLKEAMQIMGLPGWLHWFGWWARAMPTLCLTSVLLVFVVKVHWSAGEAAVMSFTSWTLLMAFLFVYALTLVAFCCMMSVFFARANVSAAIAGIVWFASFLVYQFVEPDELELGALLVLCLISNTGMAFGMQLMLRFEAAGQGSNWSNVFEAYSVDNALTVGHVMVMMLVSAMVYMLIALYVEQIRPGDFGVARPWYFPVQPKFWRSAQRWRKVEMKRDLNAAHQQEAPDAGNFESVNCGGGDRREDGGTEFNETHLRAGVQIRGLQKTYGFVKAVLPMHVDMYEDQITVLLGHNGAGKTTTVSMLTGMIRPTAGTAYVNGYDIRYDIGAVRGSMGLCPQHNILFDDLTVVEHLEFFARLKGVRDAAAVRLECAKYLQLIGLEEKAKTASAALSGGMKRKLSVCVAFCGGSKVVFCDEPSSGMDPAARRSLWDFIRQEKRGRTVLLSTHFMDEADVLGDRIAILNAGELKCCGSPYFLKKRYGVGYHLVCTKAVTAAGGNAEQTRILTAVLQRFNSDVTVAWETNTEVSFRLPDAMQTQFESVFEDLERHFAAYGLQAFGVSLTTLEDVFMNVGSDTAQTTLPELTTPSSQLPAMSDAASADKIHYTSLNTLTSSMANSTSPVGSDTVPLSLLTGCRLWLSQSRALFYKRYLQSVRSWPLLLVQMFIPTVFVVATVLIERSKRQFGNLPRLSFDLNMYDSTVTLLQQYDSTNVDVDGAAERFNREFIDVVNRTDSSSSRHMLQFVQAADDMSAYLMRLSSYMLVELNRLYYVAANISADGREVTAWFNNQPYHAAPLSLQLVHAAVLRSQLGANYAIQVTNAPLPYTNNTLVEMVALAGRMGMSLGLNIAFAMAFVMAFTVLPLVREQANRAKLLQFVSGAKVLIYWGTTLLWDFAVYLVICALLLGVFAAFQETGWSSGAEIGRIAVVLLAFGWAALPVTYLVARLFVVPTAAFTVMTILYLVAGVVMPITVTALLQYKEQRVADGLTAIFQLMPHFSLNACLRYMHEITQQRRICEVMCAVSPNCTGMQMMCTMVLQSCCEFQYFAWQRPGMAEPLTYLVAVGVVAMVLNVVIEMRWLEALWFLVWQRRWSKEKAVAAVRTLRESQLIGDEENEDEDVLEEKHRVHTMSMYEIRSQSLVVKDLSKTYRQFCAVNRISVAVDSSECFGLLGINGAGKTSTFKMLTGDLRCSAGQAWVCGIPLRTQMSAVHRIIGYCPQFDALIDEMTCREVLHMFGRLRGLRPGAQHLDSIVVQLATDLNFVRHLDKTVSACSGGNRRKLSTAVALIGRPVLVYLDEPTTGMDPGAKRHLWDVVQRQRRAGTAIVLTSHSMDECEALCTRLAIMVNGEFRCLGSVQHLKSKYAQGFVLMVRVRGAVVEEDVRRVEAFVAEHFQGAVLQNRFHSLLTYHIPSDASRKWSRMFGIMNTAKQQLPIIEDYALSQTSLEQVFLSFTEQQTADGISKVHQQHHSTSHNAVCVEEATAL